MKLRIAIKIMKGDGSTRSYRKSTLHRAVRRFEKVCRRDPAWRFVDKLLVSLGVAGRAEIMADLGDPAGALGLLLRSDESLWPGKGDFPWEELSL